MAEHGKKYQEAAKLVDHMRVYAPAEAVDLDLVHDPGYERAADRAAPVESAAAEPVELAAGHRIRLGTSSWTDPTMTAAGASVAAEDALPLANAHTIPACTNTVPANTTTSTPRSACTASFPITRPSIELR